MVVEIKEGQDSCDWAVGQVKLAKFVTRRPSLDLFSSFFFKVKAFIFGVKWDLMLLSSLC